MLSKLSRKSRHQIYRLKDRTIVPGASTISKIGEDQSYLISWANRLGHEGIDNKKEMEESAAIGSVAHHLITCWFKGDTADLEEFSPLEVSKAEELFERFKFTWDELGFTLIANELQMASEEHRYGGTLDIMAREPVNETVGIIDVKTSPRIYGNFYRQIAGYEKIWDELNEEKIAWRKIIRLDKKDPRDDEVRNLPKDMSKHFTVFKAQLGLYYAFRALND